MDNFEAEIIGKKARALKHCNKLLLTIDKKGYATIKLNSTGVTFTVYKNDAIYLTLQTTRAQLTQDIGSYEIVQRAIAQTTPRTAPAPFGAATVVDMDEAERKRIARREYGKMWRAAHPEKVAEYSRKQKEKKKM